MLFWTVYAVVAMAIIFIFVRSYRPYKAAYIARYGQPPSLNVYYKRDGDPAIERLRLRLQLLLIGVIAFVVVMIYVVRP